MLGVGGVVTGWDDVGNMVVGVGSDMSAELVSMPKSVKRSTRHCWNRRWE